MMFCVLEVVLEQFQQAEKSPREVRRCVVSTGR